MTVTTPETDDSAQEAQEATPAAQAMAVALAFALAAEQGVEIRARAWLAGRISRVDLAYSGAQMILQAIAKALLGGEHFAEIEWQHRVRPKIIPAAEHERLVRALDTITRDTERDRAADLVRTITEPDTSASEEIAETLIMRTTRLARSEVITAGRQGYAEAVEQALDPDDDHDADDDPGNQFWRFEAGIEACPRCLELAQREFARVEDAPANGAHPGCECLLLAEFREE